MNSKQRKYKFLTEKGQRILPELIKLIYLELLKDLKGKNSSMPPAELNKYLIGAFKEGKIARENILKISEPEASRLLFDKMMRSALTAAMFPNWLHSKHLDSRHLDSIPPSEVFERILPQKNNSTFKGVLPPEFREIFKSEGEDFIKKKAQVFAKSIGFEDKINSKSLSYKYVRIGFDCMLFIEEKGGGRTVIQLIDSIYELQKTKGWVKPNNSVLILQVLPFLFREVYGFGIPIAQNLLKDLGYSGFVKADTHIKKAVTAFKETECVSKNFDQEDPSQICELFNEIKEVPGLFDKVPAEVESDGRTFFLDRLFWLYFGRNFYLHNDKRRKGKQFNLDDLKERIKKSN